ncbi:MAG TPA: YggS family pyridoxal phosphate-dependent enzyme [Cytophagales bacterium]|jgi:pyridoxal phosphate enzyme (YggS family)|nr:YggS family pyridoxal phosphate-dependent enzyme [Cytophagales bacterium]
MKKKFLNKNFTCVAVSKTKPEKSIKELYDFGYRHFGENKVQELVIKNKNLPKDIHWHMIGHLQTNKVKMVVPFVYLIHSVDSLKVLSKINKESKKIGKKTNCLLQMNISNEESKYGFSINEIKEIIINNELNNFNSIVIKGLMGMASFSDDKLLIKNEFKNLKNLYELIKSNFESNNNNIDFNTLSMGMSSDYAIALNEGSNMVRIGSLLFGKRNY